VGPFCSNVLIGTRSCNIDTDCSEECPDGETDPHTECLPDGTCAYVDGCGISVDCDECANNQPPFAYDLGVDPGSYCSQNLVSGGIAVFHWIYNDTECDNESMYELQISTSPDFNQGDIVVDKLVSGISLACGSLNQVPIFVLPRASNNTDDCVGSFGYCDFINYGVDYYWRVKVWEETTGFDSGWVNYDGTYRYPYDHPAPDISYFISTDIHPGDTVKFTDSSMCYDSAGNNYFCSTLSPDSGDHVCSAAIDGKCYTWTFSDGAVDYTIGSTKHVYASSGPSSLEICDELECCALSQDVNMSSGGGGEIPQWKEISPF